MSSGRRIVICGGGAIGAAIAYFTSRGGARSTVIETIPAEALFLEYREASGEILAPELFPRADGTTWVALNA
jgi:glycine/D-amino acid oxidase-like deaminating enzyme